MTPQEEKEINESMKEPKKLTLKDRKKAQPNALLFLTEAERATIQQTIGKGLNNEQYSIFIYTCQALGLNPLLHEIAAITFGNKQGGRDMSLVVMRDGFLTIAHRSGKFAGLESGTKTDEQGKLIGWARVYHKDFTVPVYQEAYFDEYNTGRNLWTSKPKTMIAKVAESMALRKAFNVSGVYASEEMEKEVIIAEKPSVQLSDEQASKPATEGQLSIIRQLLPDEEKASLDETQLTFQDAANRIQQLTQKKGKK